VGAGRECLPAPTTSTPINLSYNRRIPAGVNNHNIKGF
jgi:hypothetical protein